MVFFRRGDSFYNPQFWAEEGSFFFSEAYHSGFTSLFHLCNGYHHFFPRMVACTSQLLHLPLSFIPAVYVYSWLGSLVLLLVYIWKRLEMEPIKLFFISLTVMFVPLQSEIVMNLTNVQWMLVFFPVIIFSSPVNEQSKKWFTADFFVLLFAGLTGPGFTVILPLIILLFYRERKQNLYNWRRTILYLLAIACGTTEAVSLFFYGTVDRTEGTFVLLNSGFVKYFFEQYAFLLIGRKADSVPFAIMFVSAIIFFIAFVFLFVKTSKKKNTFGFIALVSGFLFLIATMFSYRYDPGFLSPYDAGVRNFFVPSVTIVWTLIFLSKMNAKWITVFSCLMILFMFEIILFTGRTNFIDFHWGKYAKRIPACDTLTIPINPSPWVIKIDNRKK